MLVMAGWCCCDQWEHRSQWDAENQRVARAIKIKADVIERNAVGI